VSAASRLVSTLFHRTIAKHRDDPFVNLIDTVNRTVLSRTRVATFPAGQTGWSLFDVLPLQ
jgi:hypothetical protein